MANLTFAETRALLRNQPDTRSREDLIAFLRSLPQQGERGDIEVVHVLAEGALLCFIDDEEITHAYNEVAKWYA